MEQHYSRQMDTRKRHIERSFSRAAYTYDYFANIQKKASSLLLDRIESKNFQEILEIGCGTGGYTRMLLQAYPSSRITALDISASMLRRTREKLGNVERLRLFQADAEDLPPHISGPFDLVTSSGTMQWFQDLQGAFRSLERLLHQEGTLAFSTFGPETLFELQEAIDLHLGRKCPIPASHFPDLARIRVWLNEYFYVEEARKYKITQEYGNLLDLFKTLKGTGTSPRMGRIPVVKGPGALRQLEQKYMSIHGSIKATYEILIFVTRNRRKE